MSVLLDVLSYIVVAGLGIAAGAILTLWMVHDRVKFAREIEQRLDEEDTAALLYLQQEAEASSVPSGQLALPSTVWDGTHQAAPVTPWDSDLTQVMPAIDADEPGDAEQAPVDGEREAWSSSDDDERPQGGFFDQVDAGMDAEPTPSDEEDAEERALVPAGMSLPPDSAREWVPVPVCRRGALIERITERLARAIAAFANLVAEWKRAKEYKPRHACPEPEPVPAAQERRLTLVRRTLAPTAVALRRQQHAARTAVRQLRTARTAIRNLRTDQMQRRAA